MKQSKEQPYGSKDDDLVRRNRIAFFIPSPLIILFAVSYGYLEYYYINDPAQGKTAHLTVGGGTHRVATTIPRDLFLSYFSNYGNFILVGFGHFLLALALTYLKDTKGEKSLL